jgi:hypothetical protein
VSLDFEIEALSGFVTLCDSTLSPLREPLKAEELEDRARRGELFFIHDNAEEDSCRYRIRVFVENEPSRESIAAFENTGGSFRLDSPSGNLVLSGSQPSAAVKNRFTFALPPGSYLLQVMIRRPFDSEQDRAHREKMLGVSDARYARFVERTALGGCLTTLFAALLLIIAFWRQYKWTIIATAASPWLLHFVLRSLPRYRRIERACKDAEKQLPSVILHLRLTTAAEELPGGWIRGSR